MARIQRVRVGLTGFTGGPGVSTFYMPDAVGGLGFLRTFWDSLSGNMPVDVQCLVQNTGDIIEATDGSLVGDWSGPVQAPSQGAQNTAYAASTGFCVTWNTGQAADGSRIRGRTFVVPAAGATFTVLGGISQATITSVTLAGEALIAAFPGNLCIWHRPRVAVPVGPGHPKALAAHAGMFFPVTSVTVHDRAVVLRSRRD